MMATAPSVRERKFLPEPLSGVDAEGVFEGYASLFGEADLGKDVVMPGAFRDSLKKRGAPQVRLLWQHDPAQPIGRWLSIVEDLRGLRVRGRLNLAVSQARDIHALMRDGAVDGLSIGFRVERARAERPTGLRRLERLDLWEISVVTFPMLPGARVEAVKQRLDLWEISVVTFPMLPGARVEAVKQAPPKLAAHIRSAAVRLFS